MSIQTLTLIVTYKCTAACDQCCFGSNPGKRGRIPQKDLLSYIDQAASLGTVGNVVFTGGECFLLGRDLVEAVACASQHGLLTRCVTNGYWATSPKAARKRLIPLISAGLRELNISTGDSHRQYIPLERVRIGALTAYELGLGLAIMVESSEERALTKKLLLDDPLFGAVYKRDPEGLKIQESVWIPMDADRVINHNPRNYRNPSNPHLMRGCHNILRTIAITPDGDYLVCCGLTVEQIPDLHIANARNEPLGNIVARADRDMLRRWLRVDGPEKIIQYLQRRDPSLEYSWNRVHPCEACRDLYNRKDMREAVMKYGREGAGEMLLRYQLLEEIDTLLTELGVEPNQTVFGDGVTTTQRVPFPIKIAAESSESSSRSIPMRDHQTGGQ